MKLTVRLSKDIKETTTTEEKAIALTTLLSLYEDFG